MVTLPISDQPREVRVEGSPSVAGFRAREVVKDDLGNHFLFVREVSDGMALVESVATRERFFVPVAGLGSEVKGQAASQSQDSGVEG